MCSVFFWVFMGVSFLGFFHVGMDNVERILFLLMEDLLLLIGYFASC